MGNELNRKGFTLHFFRSPAKHDIKIYLTTQIKASKERKSHENET